MSYEHDTARRVRESVDSTIAFDTAQVRMISHAVPDDGFDLNDLRADGHGSVRFSQHAYELRVELDLGDLTARTSTAHHVRFIGIGGALYAGVPDGPVKFVQVHSDGGEVGSFPGAPGDPLGMIALLRGCEHAQPAMTDESQGSIRPLWQECVSDECEQGAGTL